jgi:WD40 repeat protein
MASAEKPRVAETQLRELCAQLERRLANGEKCRAEEYLAAYPALAIEPESALDLIYTEYVVRTEFGECPQPDEYYTRFPQWRDMLSRQFQVHDLLSVGPLEGKPQVRGRPGETVRARLWKTNPDNFEVLEQIARGSSGVVYTAWQKSPPRVVALKAFPFLRWADDEHLARFRREAAAAARLIHPNIVQLYNVSEWEEIPYLVLECVDGGTLADKWGGAPQLQTPVAEIVLTVARAVEYAHGRGVVHRDLRPGNILMTKSGDPKITDFGLAKLLVAQDDDLTLKDQVLGTPGYMAPEQAEGRSKHAGAPADVYSLGAMLYEGLTGRPPFRGQTVLDTLHQVAAQTPLPPEQFKPGLSRDLQSICLKCLRKSPEDRYASAAELADDLRRFLAGEPTAARPLGGLERVWRWCKRNPLAATLTLALTVMSLAALLFVTTLWRHEVWAHHELQIAQEAAIREKAIADEQRRRTERLSASIIHDQAMAHADHGNSALALLLLSQSLELAARDGDRALERLARMNVTAYRAELVRRRVAVPHPDWVWSATFSPDGKRFVTVSKDKSARLWDTETGKPFGEAMRHDMPVWSAAFSPDGKHLLTGCGDPETKKGTLRLWTAATGRPAGPSFGEDKIVVSVAFSPDGRTLLILDLDTAQLWDRASLKPAAAPLAHPGTVLTAVFSPDGKTVLTGGKDGSARLWKVPGGEATGLVLQHLPPPDASPELQPRVVAAAFSPDGRFVATASQWIDVKQKRYVGGEARVWFTASGKPVGAPLAHPGPLKTVAFGPKSQRVLTGSFVIEGTQKDIFRGEARLWDVGSGRQIGATLQHTRPVWTTAFSPNGRVLLTGGEEGVAKFWLAATSKNIGSTWASGNSRKIEVSPDGKTAVVGHTYTPALAELMEIPPGWGSVLNMDDPPKIKALVFSHDGKLFATDAGTGKVQLWDEATMQPQGSLPHEAGRCPVVFSIDGKMLLTAWAKDELHWCACASGAPTGPSLKHRSEVIAAFLSPNGKLLWTRDSGGRVYAWDTATNELHGSLDVGGGHTAVGLRSGSMLVATVTGTDVIRWDLLDPRRVGPVLRHPEEVTSLAISPSGNLLATGCEDGSAQLWDMATGKAHGNRLEHLYTVAGVAFSPNGKTLLTWGQKNNVVLWDVATGKPASPALPHGSEITAALFSPDSRSVAVVSGTTVYIWDVATGRRVGPLLVHPEPVTRLSFHPKGRYLATICEDGTVRFFDLPRPANGTPSHIREWIEALTGRALGETGTFLEIDPQALVERRRQLRTIGGEPFPLR